MRGRRFRKLVTVTEITLPVFVLLSLLFPRKPDLTTSALLFLLTVASTLVILKLLPTVKLFGKEFLLRSAIGKRLRRAVDAYEGKPLSRPTSAIEAVTEKKRRGHRSSSVLLVGTIGAYLLFVELAGEEMNLIVVGVLVSAIVAINLAAFAMEYRIRTGLYGTNEYEAREILRYVIESANHVDLSGGLGATEPSPAGLSEVPVPQGLRGAHS